MSYLAQHDIERLMEPTRYDQIIAQVFPKWGAKRMRARREYAYEAAVNTRLRTTATRLQGPEDFQAFPDRLQLIRQVRDLEQNFGLFQGIMDKLGMYAFGRIRYQSRTGSEADDDQYEEYLADVLSRCDISGRYSFRRMVEIALKSILRDGDYCLQWQRDRLGDLKLRGIEGDRLGGIYMVSADETYFQGITIDVETGAPRSYRIYYRTKADSYVNPVEVPSQNIIHLLNPRRYDQYRGVSDFAPIINEARDFKELHEALRIGTKFENYHSAVIYTESGLPLDNPTSWMTGTETVNGAPTTEQEIKYGVMQHAPTGSKVDWLKSDRPSGTVQTYMESLIRLMGVALKMPYGFLYNLSGLSGPGARMDSQQAQRVIQLWQEDLTTALLNRVKDTYLIEGFAKGAIRYNPNWKKGVWQFPPWPTIDVGRDSAAGINEWRAGLKSKDAWFSETGEDAEEQEVIMENEARRTLTSAQKLADEFEIPIELSLTMLETKTQQGFFQASGAQSEPEEPEPTKSEPEKAEPAEMQRIEIVHKVETAKQAEPVRAIEPPTRLTPIIDDREHFKNRLKIVGDYSTAKGKLLGWLDKTKPKK